MNLDEMISKYLDGELSQEEDIQLRKMISEEDAARQIFDTAVHIHLAVKEDSDALRPPKTLVSDTEDKILMKILSAQPVSVDTVFRKQRSYALATLVFLFLLSGVFRISDMNFFYTGSLADKGKAGNVTVSQSEALPNANKGAQSSTANYENYETEKNQASSRISVRDQSVAHSDLAGNDSRAESNNNSQSAILADNSAPVTAPPNSVMNPGPASTAGSERAALVSSSVMSGLKTTGDADNGKINSQPTQSYGVALPRDTYQAQMSIMNSPLGMTNGRESIENLFPNGKLDFLSASNEIQITSFLGTDILRGGLNTNDKSAVSHVSQSIAYSVSDKSRVGVEVGYTHYTIEETTYINIPSGSDESRVGEIEKIKGASGKSIEKLNPGGEFFEQPLKFDRNQQLLWGAAFYERELLRYNDLYINGRIGAGASSEGLLSYGRLFSKYQLFNGLFITLGTEGRIFSADLPKFSNENQSKIKSSFSLIYGLQVKF